MPSVHRQTLVDLVKAHGWQCGAELGVDKGILTGMLLRECHQLNGLMAVDTFPDRTRSRRVFDLMESDGRLTVWEGTTRGVALGDGAGWLLDFVFIDADHSYEAVKEDIALWSPKVRKGGWLGGHDYHPRKFPGVVRAVDEAFGSRVQYYPGTIWGVWV